MAPAEPLPGLAGIAEQRVGFRRPEVTLVDFDQNAAVARIDALLGETGAAPFDGPADAGERLFDEFADRMLFAGRQNVIVGLRLLHDQPHAFRIVAGMAPVAPGGKIAEKQLVLQAELDRGDGAGDLAGDEGFAARRPFVIEQDAVRGMHVIGFAIIDRDPIGVKLGRRIGRARIKRRGFALRYFLRQTVKLRRRGLIEPDLVLEAQDADGFKQAQRAERVGIGGVFRRLERDPDVALGGEIVDFGRLHFLNDADEIGRIGHIAVVQEKPHAGAVRVQIQMIDAARC